MSATIFGKGQVVEVTSTHAKVRTTRSEACTNCAARCVCHPFGEKTSEIVVENTIDAEVGQEVLLEMRSSSLVNASFLLYLVPLGFVILGAVSGYLLAGPVASLSRNLGLVVGMAAGLLASFFVVRALARRFEKSESFQVRLVRPGQDVTGSETECKEEVPP